MFKPLKIKYFPATSATSTHLAAYYSLNLSAITMRLLGKDPNNPISASEDFIEKN